LLGRGRALRDVSKIMAAVRNHALISRPTYSADGLAPQCWRAKGKCKVHGRSDEV